MTEKDILSRAYDLLTEFGWTQGNYAVDDRGLACPAVDRGAVSFCAMGALHRAWHDLRAKDEMYAIAQGRLALAAMGDWQGSVPGWNDSASRDEVLAAFRVAAGLSKHAESAPRLALAC